MDPVTGALIAAVIGWISILIVVRMPLPKLGLHRDAVKHAGGAAIATIALAMLGIPMPHWMSLAVFASVLGVHWLLRATPPVGQHV